jgi:hypothetical protein
MLIVANEPLLADLHSLDFSDGCCRRRVKNWDLELSLGNSKISEILIVVDALRVTRKVVLERFLLGAKSQKDAVASFTRHGLTEEDLIRKSLLQIVAGSDTSAATIHVVLLNLLINPQCYQRLQVEVDSALVAGKMSSPILQGRNYPTYRL